MPNVRQLRRRIRSIQSTIKVTRAMEMIAASKMRRAQQAVLASRPYSQRIHELLAHLAAQVGPEEATYPLMQRREVRRIELVHVTTDRGLCGGLNGNINRRSGQFILQQSSPVSVVTVGRKGRDFMVRFGREVRAVFTDVGDQPRVADILPIAQIITEDYASGFVDQVYLVYNQFVSVTTQRPIMEQLLPVEPAAGLEPSQATGYIYEPDVPQVLAALLPRFVEMELYHALLESAASEQAARMVAMRNATDNAGQMLDDLTLLMNKVRQESITGDLLDIVGGVVALEG